VGEIIKDLCRQRVIELLEGNLRPDHVHMCLSVPPKFSVFKVISLQPQDIDPAPVALGVHFLRFFIRSSMSLNKGKITESLVKMMKGWRH
jgi:hypothetical protein